MAYDQAAPGFWSQVPLSLPDFEDGEFPQAAKMAGFLALTDLNSQKAMCHMASYPVTYQRFRRYARS